MMKCINCYREIEDGLKFCTKCGFRQPEDREAYEREHPELADAIPEDEMFEKIEQVKVEKSDAMSYDDLVQSLSADPHCDDILMMINEGLVFFSITNEQEPDWYAKCANLINDKMGFYPFFIQCLNEEYEKARSLLYNQARSNWSITPTTTEQNVQATNNEDPDLPPPMPIQAPVMPVAPPQPQPVVPINNTYPPAYNNTYNQAYTTPAPPATKNCPYCGNIIPAEADMCPYCLTALNYGNNPNNVTNYDDSDTPPPMPVQMPVAAPLPQPLVPINNTYTPAYTTPAAGPTKNCPYCNSIIPAGADMCPYCYAALNYGYIPDSQ